MKMVNSEESTSNQVNNIEFNKRLIAMIICFGIPIILLIGAYIHMGFRYERLWLFDTIVHERGKYTFLEVILYFRHFLWELPMKTLFACMLVGIFYYFGKFSLSRELNQYYVIPFRPIILSGIIALIIASVAFFMASSEHGFKEALLGFCQSRSSELRPLQYGSHWRNHFLSNIVLYCSSVVTVLLYRIFVNGGHWERRRFWFLFPLAAGLFILITIIFGFTMDPFQTPSYLGHQLREIFGSDLSITMLLTMGILIHLEGKYDINENRSRPIDKKKQNKLMKYAFFWSVPAVVLSLFLILKVLNLDMSGEMAKLGSTEGWTKLDLFAWHFFEHSLDYTYASALVVFLYLGTLKIEVRKLRKQVN